MLVALLGVLALGVWGAYAVFAAASPPAPTLSSTPSNPSNNPTPTISYSDSQSGAAFACTLDEVSTPCSSVNGSGVTIGSASLPSLTAGSHTFSVRATSGGKTSSATSYTWVVDTTAPTVAPPALAATSPASSSSVSWTVTFSESVKNVATTNFALASPMNLTGPSITGISGSGAVYTVTANTGTLTNATLNGSLGLNMTSKGSGATAITDLAGNAQSALPGVGGVYTIDRNAPPVPVISSGPSGSGNPATATFGFSDSETGVSYLCKLDSGSYTACANPATFSGLSDGSHALTVEAKDAAGNTSGPSAVRTWSVDATPPPKPTIVGPNNKSGSTSATFTITDSDANVTYKCQMDGGGYTPCTSSVTYTLLSAGTHVFDAEPIDQAGNIGPFNEWKWTINGLSGSGQPFTIANPVLPLLYPGGATDPMNLSLTNPNSVTIYITSLTVSLSIGATPHSGPAPCTTADFTLAQYSGGYPIALPPGTKTLQQLGYTQAQWPSIKMLNRPANQDRCQNATLNFSYTGQAQS
jgi:hypothetical protein